MNADELSNLGSLDDKLIHVYYALYGAKNETQLFLDILKIHACSKTTQPEHRRESLAHTTELTPVGPKGPDPLPLFFLLEHSTPADLRNFTFAGANHVPGSPLSWKVLRKLMATIKLKEDLEISQSHLLAVLELLAVCQPDGLRNLSRSSHWWLIELESEFIRFVHDIVHQNQFLQASGDTLNLSYKTALRYFHSAFAHEKASDSFSKHFRGFVILHAYSNHTPTMQKLAQMMANVPEIAPESANEGVMDENAIPALVTECLSGMRLGKRRVTWKKRDHGKQPFSMTYYVTEVSHSKVLPYSLGVLKALNDHDARFLSWFLKLDGLDILVEILDLELEYECAAVIPSRLYVLLTTLQLLKDSILLHPDSMDVLAANPRIFLRLFDLTSHVKTQVKQIAMALIAELTSTPWICQGVYSMQVFEELPVFGNADSTVLEQKLKQLKAIFGATVLDVVSRMGAKLATTCNMATDKGHRLTRDDYMSSVDAKERKLVANSIWKTINACIGTNEHRCRLRFTQQIFRILIEDQARLLRTKRQSSASSSLLVPQHVSLELFGFLRKCSLLRSLDMEQIGAMCRRIPMPQAFSPVTMTDLIVVCRGTVTVSYKPTMFSFQLAKSVQWKRSFGRGEIVCIAQELMNIKLDIFQGHSVLHGILNAIDIWSTSVLRQSPSIVKTFSDAGLHVGFARLLNSCDGGLLCDVLHLMLLFCLDEPTRRMLWAERTFHRGIKPVLCKMSVELEEAINLDRDKIYCDFFNLLLDAERDQVYSRAYRHFFGSNTTLVSTLTHRILKVELSPDHQFELAMCMECLWRLCYEHEGNAKQVARSCDETDIIDVLGNFFERSHRHTEFQIAVLLLIRSLCTDPLFATKFWVASIAMLAGAVVVHEQLVMHWTSTGSFFVSSLLKAILGKPDEDGDRAKKCCSLLMTLLESRHKPLVQHIVNMHSDLEEVVKCAFSFRPSPSKLHAVQVTLVSSVLNHLAMDIHATMLFANISEYFGQYDSFPPSCRHVCFEILTSTLAAKLPHRHPKTPLLRDVLATLAWGKVVKDVLNGIRSSSYHVQLSSLRLLDALFTYSTQCTLRELDVMEISVLQATLSEILDGFTNNTCVDTRLEEVCRSSASSIANCSTAFDVPFDVPLRQCRRAVYAKPSRAKETVNENEANLYQNHGAVYFFALKCIQVLDMDAKSITVHNISPMTSNFDWGCSFVVYRTVNADMFDADSVHAMLLLLYSGILHSGGGNGNSDVVANDPFMHCLLRFAGSHAYLQLRQIATALFWKLLHCADASIVSAICTLVSQFKFCLLRNLHENLTLVEPLIGATLTPKDAWKDLLLTTCGLLCEFCVDAAMSASIASRNYIRDILALLQADRPNQLNAMNIQFLTMIERMIQSGLTSLHMNNRGLLPHCLQCLALDNSEALRSQAVYVLYLFCQEMTGLDLLKTTVFPHVANPSTHASKVAADESTNNELQAGIHMYALSESLKCNQPRPQRAAMYLVCELCADPHHAAALRICRQSSSSLINLVAHVLAATLGTTHRNRVQFRGVVDVSETDARFTFVTGCYALQCLQRLDVFADVFSDVVCGNKVMVQLFAALGWANSEVCRPAVALLCGIYQYALKSKVEQKSQFGPKENSSDEGIDLAILTDQSRDHLLNRMKCFRHKVATQIPSYIKLLADWVSWFCAHRPLSHADVLSSILELISTSVQLFFPTIYFPIHATTRVHHQTLLENVFDIAFGQHDHVLGEAAASVHMEALGVLANLCNHTEYACARFESPSAMKMLLDCTERSTGRLQRVAGQLLQAVTKHQSVKECIYSNKLMSFMSWINLPNFDPILGNLLHAVKNLIEKPTTPSPHYDATTIATLLLKATPTQCQNLPPATNFRRMQLRLSVKCLNANTIVMNPTFTARIDHDDNVTILRRVYVSSSLHVELSWLHSIDVRNITVHLELSSPGHDTIFVHHACGFDTPTTFSGHDSAYSIEGHVSDVSATDLQSLTGPLGEVLKFCVQEKKLPEMGLLSALIGELCKHDEVFCNVDLNLWCFIAYLLQNGSATGGNSQGMQCLKAIAATASAQHKHLKTFVSHVMFMIQLLDIYGMSSSKIQLPDDRSGHHIGHPHCMRNKESILFMVAVADMVASYGSVSFVENVMRQLFIEHCGVVMFLCGEHRGKEHSCSGYFFIQTHFIHLLPSHPILLSQDCFVQTNLRHFVECAHSSDDCVKHATKMMLHIVSNSIACQQFVLHNGLHLLGRVAQILMNNNLTKGTRHFAPALCQIVLVASFLSANILSQVPLPLEFERLFFPSAVSKDVMPFLEILLWPLMPVDGAFTWTESSLLAAKVLSDVMEKRSSRLLLENHLIHISFRLSQSRVLLVQAALATCLDCTAWDQKHAVDVIQRVYFVAVRKGIKLGMLSAECTELLPQTSKSEQDVSHRSHKSIMAQSSTKLNVVPAKTEGRPMHETLNPYRDQLLYCLNFTEQHREGRLRDILVRSRKKGISDMLSAVNNSARVLVLIHQVLEMFFETYVSVVSAVHIEYSDVKVKKMRFFCKQLESIAAVVVTALNQMEASYFGVIFAQLHDIRVPNYGVTDPVECRNTMRSNMKKLLFILKRIIDKKKLKPLLDEQSFVEAEEIMGSIRLDFAVNGRRRLGHAALDNASIADFLCEAAELGGLKKFDEFIAGTRYLYARSMLRDDGTVDNLEDFMMGTSDNMTLKEAIKELINAILTQIKTIFCSPFRLARRMVERFASSQAAANVVTSSASFPVLLKPNFAEDFLAGLLSKRQELIIDHLLNPENAIHDDVLERKLTSTEIHIVMLNIENFLARQDTDIALYYVHPSTLPVNVWNFVVSPVYHTRLMHAHYLLNDLKSADSLASAQALWQTLEKGHSFVTQAIRLSPMMKLKTTKRKMSQKHASAPFVRRKSWCPWKWHKPSPDGGDYDGASLNTDEIRRKPMGVLYTNYILPVCDRQLDDPLSDQMAWEHLIGEINAGKYPPWVFRINDSVCSPHLRRATKAYRSLLRGIIYLTFWRLEEYFLDLQDRSWPEGEVIRLTCTSRKCLEEDIVESIVIYKHFKKAMSELFRVW
ncbi:hypothetical protein DYB32_000094 [Aphanomyces invadans]|uniref:Uncharacterized protein n=1 Tax=Aphanomyces invadans TaxID=157072 RepID=A0A418BB04_9STRA|nr:hypothetical protein DYB32_000094 [Aphanomyces invadans]